MRFKAPLVSLLVALTWAVPVTAAASDRDLARAIAAQMRAVGGYSGAWVADSGSGKTIYERFSTVRRTPASVQKLLTTSTALERFGHDQHLETLVSQDGALTEEGELDGDLYLRGFGDPSFDSSALSTLASQVRAAGVESVKGRVLGDESYFDSRRGLPAGGFRISSYVGPLSALSFNQGTMRGFGGGFQSDPPRFAAQRLDAWLDIHGVKVKRAPRAGTAPLSNSLVASVRSPSIASLVRGTNQPSQNYYAEMLLKGLGARFSSNGSTTAGAGVVRRFMESLGVEARIADGSGLSRSNAISPRAVGRLLLAARQADWFDAFYRSLPLAGRTGTIRKRMRGTAAVGRCRAKTGTLSGVSALAGYCRSRAGRKFTFALLMNGVNVWRARTSQDRIAAALAR